MNEQFTAQEILQLLGINLDDDAQVSDAPDAASTDVDLRPRMAEDPSAVDDDDIIIGQLIKSIIRAILNLVRSWKE